MGKAVKCIRCKKPNARGYIFFAMLGIRWPLCKKHAEELDREFKTRLRMASNHGRSRATKVL